MTAKLRTDDDTWLTVWGEDWLLAGCATCNGVFVLPPEKMGERCPFCGQTTLSQMNANDDHPIYTQPPELVVPYRVEENQLRTKVAQFAKSVWLASSDLSETNLLARLQPIYLPMWLVDAQVQSEWQAEMGFDYEIVSHREQYHNSHWQTERVKEGRVRWEPRVGRLNRTYDNLSAPALEEQHRVEEQVGRFTLDDTKPFQRYDLAGAMVHLPNRPPEDAWNDAVWGFKLAVSEDCRLAAEADHMRGFNWSPHFTNQQWTQLLLPLYTSYYLDDDNQAQVVLLHGQTGKLHGPKRASMKRARRIAGIILAITAVFLVVTLLLLLLGFTLDEAALPWAGMLVVFTVGVGGTAVLPLAYAWYINNVAAKSG